MPLEAGEQPEGQGAQFNPATVDWVPEEHREAYRKHLAETNKLAEERNQLKEFHDRYSPVVGDYDPEDLQGSIQTLAAIQSDPDAFNDYGRQLGYLDEELDEDMDEFDESDELRKELQELKKSYENLQGGLESITASQAARDKAEEIIDSIEELEDQHGEFSDEQADLIYRTAEAQMGSSPKMSIDDAVKEAFDLIQKVNKASQTKMVKEKAQQPTSPEIGGSMPSSEKKIESEDDSRALIRERLSQATE